MPRYIDADELQKQYDELPLHKHSFYTTQIWEGIFRGLLKEAKTYAVAPVVHGRWEDLRISYNDVPRYNCTNCGVVQYTATRHKYCPNCGAKMDAEEDNNDSD